MGCRQSRKSSPSARNISGSDLAYQRILSLIVDLLTPPYSHRGIFFFTGPVLLTFATIFEWIMGNFFPMMVMALFDVFWLSFGVLQLPTLQLGAPYATEADPTGTTAPAFNAAIALYLIVWGFALLTFFIFTLKINVIFAFIFGLVTVASFVLAGAYFKVSQGNFDDALKLQKVSRGTRRIGKYAKLRLAAKQNRLVVH
jgi:succinate-acetate transporter protein